MTILNDINQITSAIQNFCIYLLTKSDIYEKNIPSTINSAIFSGHEFWSRKYKPK